uniref:Lipid-binding serum glycoprotein N-terminal domain-containing protein n=1 Tax=Plectus sambesii TaxID=2011161 RepID=A0A914V3D9_9BILA
VGSGWLSVSKSGSLTASTNDASASISVDVTTSSDGHPALSPHSCGSDLGDLGIEFHGDLIDDIIDLFKKYISDYVKGKVEGIICDQVSSIIANEGNSFLRQVPISIALPDPMTGFDLDYGLTENPIATDSYIAVPLKAKFWYQGHENDAGIPQA